jgi:outer membrane immunogenic protein
MRNLSLAGVALAAFIGFSSAQAADLGRPAPVYKAPPPVLPYNWTGIYIGGTVGGVFGDWSYTTPAVAFNSATNKVSGVLGGPTLGFNWQTGPWVLGVEGDWSWSDAKATDFSGCTIGCDNRYRWFATARGRVGYAFDRFLPYVTAGGAFTNTEDASGPTDLGSKTFGGWTAGGGVEWAFWQNWSAKIEYLHMDFGDQTIFAPGLAINGVHNVSLVHHDSNLNIVRAGLNYKFNWMP